MCAHIREQEYINITRRLVYIQDLYANRNKMNCFSFTFDCHKLPLLISQFHVFLLISGYEVEGLQNIPSAGPALIIYYHGAIPVDFYYVVTAVLLESGRHVHMVGDKFLFYIPGIEMTGQRNIHRFMFLDVFMVPVLNL